MADSGLIRPQAFDVIPAEQVSALIAAADRDFAVLERQAQEAEASAAAIEADALAAGIDPKATTWTMVRLQRFLEGLNEEAKRDAAATIEVARRRAQVMREEAGLHHAGSAVSPQFSAPVVTEPPPAKVVTEPPVPTVVVSPFPETPEPPAPVAPIQTPPVVMTDVVSPTSTNGSDHSNVFADNVPSGLAVATAVPPLAVPSSNDVERELFTPPASAPVPVIAVPATPVPIAPVPVASAPAAPVVEPTATLVVPPPVQQQPPPAAEARPASAPAPAPAAAKAKRSMVRRLPVSAILEVIAVLLILVFILLRLS